MRITELELKGFGKFQDKTISFAPGINVIRGKNEAGKSTVHAYIRAMLFGLERTRGRAAKDDRYQKYLPWESGAAYGGSMDFELDGKQYRILRNFHKNQKSVSCICLDTGREVSLPTGQITDLIPGLTESLYRNTVSLEQQKTRTDAELAGQVRNYITNIAAAGSSEVDVKRALAGLQEERKQAESVLKELEGRLAAVSEEIEHGREGEARLARLVVRQKELLAEQSELTHRLFEVKGEIARKYDGAFEQFPAIQEKYEANYELEKQAGQQKEKEQQLRLEIQHAGKDREESDRRAESLNEIAELIAARREVEHQKRELAVKQREEEATRKNDYRRRSAVVVGVGLVITILCLLMQNIPGSYLGVYGGIVLMLTGGILYLISEKKTQQRKAPYEEELAGLEQKILRYESKRHDILLEHNVLDERDLRAKYEAGLQKSVQAEQLLKQAEWYASERTQLEQRIKKNQEDIISYALRFLNTPENVLNEEYMKQLAKRVAECREENKRRVTELEEERAQCSLHLEKLKWEIDRMQDNEERLTENEALWKELEELRTKQQEDIRAIRLAISTIEELSARLHDNFGGKFGQDVSEAVCRYTGGEHEKAYLDEKLNIRISSGKEFVPLEGLSIGTIDQVYLALRLTAAQRLTGRTDLPILLDDSFAYYDDTRLKTVLTDLAESSSQILLFTCQTREERTLTEQNCTYQLIDL